MLLTLFRSPRLADLQLDRPLVVLDTETTGTDPQSDRIVHLGLIRLDPDGSSDEFETLVNPGLPIPAAATAVHGIDDAGVERADVRGDRQTGSGLHRHRRPRGVHRWSV